MFYTKKTKKSEALSNRKQVRILFFAETNYFRLVSRLSSKVVRTVPSIILMRKSEHGTALGGQLLLIFSVLSVHVVRQQNDQHDDYERQRNG